MSSPSSTKKSCRKISSIRGGSLASDDVTMTVPSQGWSDINASRANMLMIASRGGASTPQSFSELLASSKAKGPKYTINHQRLLSGGTVALPYLSLPTGAPIPPRAGNVMQGTILNMDATQPPMSYTAVFPASVGAMQNQPTFHMGGVANSTRTSTKTSTKRGKTKKTDTKKKSKVSSKPVAQRTKSKTVGSKNTAQNLVHKK